MTFEKFYKKLKNLDYKTWLMLHLGYKNMISDGEGLSLLINSCCYHDYDITKLLLNFGVDVNVKSNVGETALMYCCYYYNIESLKFLIKFGAIIDDYDEVIGILELEKDWDNADSDIKNEIESLINEYYYGKQ